MNQVHALQMLNVFIEMVLALVAVLKIIMEIHMKDVDQNVCYHQIVHQIKLAFVTNVRIHAKAFVDWMLNVCQSIMCQLAFAEMATLVIHSPLVKYYAMNQLHKLLLTFADQRHADCIAVAMK